MGTSSHEGNLSFFPIIKFSPGLNGLAQDFEVTVILFELNIEGDHN